jgi:phosphoenolpyruvate-protein kinase (PTS system EI component)
MASSGGTPFFTYAGAGVVNTGGVMSHAAIIGPRTPEFEIPCVVGSKTGSRVLRTEHVVEVDGGPDVSRRDVRGACSRSAPGRSGLAHRRRFRALRMNGVSVGYA